MGSVPILSSDRENEKGPGGIRVTDDGSASALCLGGASGSAHLVVVVYPCGLSPLPCCVMWADDSSSLHLCYLISIPKGSCESQADDVLQGAVHTVGICLDGG